MSSLKYLDCTLRDGGFLNDWRFTDQQVVDCYNAVSNLDYDYIEVGFRSTLGYGNHGKWFYSTDEDIEHMLKHVNNHNLKITVMSKIGCFEISDFKLKSESPVDMVRVLLPKCLIKDGTKYFEYDPVAIQECKNFISQLDTLGYEVSLNLACCDNITDFEIEYISQEFKDLPIKYLYVADSYSGLTDITTRSLLNKFNKFFPERVGFHAHNNFQNALSKTLVAIDNGTAMVDSCIGGYGKGAGNLPTELISMHFKELSKKFIPLFEYIEKYLFPIIEYRNRKIPYCYHPLFALSASLCMHQDYIDEIMNKHQHLSIKNIILLLLKLHKNNVENNTLNYNSATIEKISKEIF